MNLPESNLKKRALLIGCPLSSNSLGYLAGVVQDIGNYSKFLLSSNGGGWREDEITILNNPSFEDFQYSIRGQDDADFAMTIFSGHGFISDFQQYLRLNDQQIVNDYHLLSDASRQLVIVDACRDDYPYYQTPRIAGLGLEFDHDFKEYSRALYDKAVLSAPFGHILLYSTSPFQTAKDTEDGGAFTVELFSSVSKWINTDENLLFPVGNCFAQTRNGLKAYDFPQTPVLEYSSREMCAIPIAVNIKPHFKQKYTVNFSLSRNQRQPKGVTVRYIS
jgi:hypothetical protein